jgi:DNA-binding XRE family transcriptional regulator
MPVMAQSKKLLFLRLDAGFDKQQELADAAGVHVTRISYAETGRPISLKTKHKIVNALKAKGMKVEIEDIDWSGIK